MAVGEYSKAEVENCSNFIRVTAGRHILDLPSSEGPFDSNGIDDAAFAEGLFFLISSNDGALVAYDEHGKRLWTIPPQRRTPMWISGFVGVRAGEENGKIVLGFGDSIGHAYRVTDLRSGTFKYIGVSK